MFFWWSSTKIVQAVWIRQKSWPPGGRAYFPYICIYTERKKKRRVNFIPKFHSSLKKFVKYFTMITKRYMYGTKVPNFIGLWSTSLELLKFIGSYPPNLVIKIKLKINIRQYGKPKFRAKQACLNLQHKISSHHLVHVNDTQRSSILLPIFLFIFTLLYATLNLFSIMVRLTDVQRGRAIESLMQGQRQQQVANHFGVNVSTIERLVRRLRETGHLADQPRSGRPHVM